MVVAFLFAGQGSQYIGMGKELYESFAEARAVFDQAEQVLGFDIKKRCFEGPAEILKNTATSQPAIVTVSIAALEAFKAKSNIRPEFAAGLSLGEYSALIAAGVLSFADGLRLVRRRSEIMEEATLRHPGAMAAVIDLSYQAVKDICLATGAEVANINAPGQIVISGKAGDVKKAVLSCEQAGAKRVIPLEVSGGFHSSLMFEAAQELKAAIAKAPFSSPAAPIVSNYTALPAYEAVTIEENLVRQMYSPVKWEEGMRFMLSKGVKRFFEFGPGKVLRGLMRRIEPLAEVRCIENKEDILKNQDIR